MHLPQAEASRAETLADKAQALPPEPPAGGADTVAVLIRLPNGQRRSRRCAAAMQHLCRLSCSVTLLMRLSRPIQVALVRHSSSGSCRAMRVPPPHNAVTHRYASP